MRLVNEQYHSLVANVPALSCAASVSGNSYSRICVWVIVFMMSDDWFPGPGMADRACVNAVPDSSSNLAFSRPPGQMTTLRTLVTTNDVLVPSLKKNLAIGDFGLASLLVEVEENGDAKGVRRRR